MSIFDDLAASIDEAESMTKHYTPSVQETMDETPESVDNFPATEAEIEALSKGDAQPFNEGDRRERADNFQIHGEWVNPVIRARRKQAMVLPSSRMIDDLDQRIAAVVRFGGAPKEVSELATKARVAVAAARSAHDGAQHPDSRRFAVSQPAKDDVVKAIAEATTLVGALEAVVAREDIQEQWFDSLTSNLDAQRQKAAKALEAASKFYAEWRQAIAAAEALAKEQGRWGDWHHSPQERELNPLGLIGEIRKARDIAQSEDDWISGAYLRTEYDGIPPHTMAYLEESARRAPGSYAEMTLHRLKSPHDADGPALDTIRERDLRIVHTRPVPDLKPKQAGEQ